MTLRHHTRLILLALASGAIAGPAIAGTAPQTYVNQGPHAFGDPTASGLPAAGSMASPNFVNQGPHGFGDPTVAHPLAPAPMTSPPAPANRGPHAMGG